MIANKLILGRNVKVSVLLFTLLLFLTTSCRVIFVPNYSAELVKQIESVSKKINVFYLQMSEDISLNSNSGQYLNYSDDYVHIQVELQSLYNKNKVRPLNENSTRICEISLELWEKYKEEHRNDTIISKGIIRLNLKTFEGLMYAMMVAEKAKAIVANPPN